MKGYEGQNAASISEAILTFFLNVDISWLWIDQSQFIPNFFSMTVEDGVKKSVFLKVGQFWTKN